ncbi:GH25 family lysozyme [Sphaerisporangium sp. B11E5]|uniref:GH25 family lysozyme n=1 Tax=Sphaerisporangium sp. B11E5 TaxID=3153563 RepID=UPI00325DD8B5
MDVTHYQHPDNANVNWSQVAGAGIRFATLKATESTTYTDPWFTRDIAAARAAGVPVAPYHFYVARSANTGAAQADHFISVVRATGYTGKRPGDLPPVFDFEWDWKTGACPAYGSVADAKAFLDRVQAAFGVRPIIYTSRGFMTSCMGSSTALSSYPLQIADYVSGHTTPALPPGWTTWTMWQYANKGSVAGIPTTNVTLNVFNGTQRQLDALANKGPNSGSIDGNGSADILARYTDGTLHWYPNKDDGTFWSARDLGPAPGFQLMAMGDIDGNGYADMLARYTDGTLHWYPNKGDGTFWSARDLGPAPGFQLMAMGDIDGNGSADILARYTDGTLHWYPNKGDGTFWSARDLGPAPGFQLMAMGDIDGNGSADILARYTDGTLHWYPNKGDGTFWSARDLGPAPGFQLMAL